MVMDDTHTPVGTLSAERGHPGVTGPAATNQNIGNSASASEGGNFLATYTPLTSTKRKNEHFSHFSPENKNCDTGKHGKLSDSISLEKSIPCGQVPNFNDAADDDETGTGRQMGITDDDDNNNDDDDDHDDEDDDDDFHDVSSEENSTKPPVMIDASLQTETISGLTQQQFDRISRMVDDKLALL